LTVWRQFLSLFRDFLGFYCHHDSYDRTALNVRAFGGSEMLPTSFLGRPSGQMTLEPSKHTFSFVGVLEDEILALAESSGEEAICSSARRTSKQLETVLCPDPRTSQSRMSSKSNRANLAIRRVRLIG
jgi:hypothetical protein